MLLTPLPIGFLKCIQQLGKFSNMTNVTFHEIFLE